MDLILKKLHFKGQKELFVLNPPDTITDIIQTWSSQVTIIGELPQLELSVHFVMAFIQTQEHINKLVPQINAVLIPDGILWMVYPKGSSKRFTCDFNRDKGWNIFGELGYEAVRQVAIDEDWSALRFRKATFIKTLSRNEKMALSKEGKERTILNRD